MENMDTTEQHAIELDRQSAQLRSDALDSFDRCDTDGFVSQWADGINAGRLTLEAQIVRQGGTHTFPALFTTSGQRVRAKLIEVADKFRGYGKRDVWMVIGSHGQKNTFITPLTLDVIDGEDGQYTLKPNKRSANRMARQGYFQGVEVAPAKAVVMGEGRGLSGRAWSAIVRDDCGYPSDAM